MSAEGWGIIFVLGMFAVIAAVITVVLWQIFKTQRSKITSRSAVAQEEAYRKLAEESTATQQRLAEQQERMAADMADLRERVAAIEKMMREVE